ncbi:hypothetical protein Ciccas_005663, partial [Cichlidogyrus casuarinus]
FLPNSNISEWSIVSVTFKKENYVSKPGHRYQYISIGIELKRQPLYFIILVVVPFLMLSFLAALIFMLDSMGDRFSVAVSLVLSMTMYVVIVSTNAPRSMRTLPVLCIYLLNQMGMLCIATVLAVVNLRHKQIYTEKIQDVKKVHRMMKLIHFSRQQTQRQMVDSQNGKIPAEVNRASQSRPVQKEKLETVRTTGRDVNEDPSRRMKQRVRLINKHETNGISRKELRPFPVYMHEFNGRNRISGSVELLARRPRPGYLDAPVAKNPNLVRLFQAVLTGLTICDLSDEEEVLDNFTIGAINHLDSHSLLDLSVFDQDTKRAGNKNFDQRKSKKKSLHQMNMEELERECIKTQRIDNIHLCCYLALTVLNAFICLGVLPFLQSKPSREIGEKLKETL